MATHSSILAWEIPGTEEPAELQTMGLQRIRHMIEHWHAHILSYRELLFLNLTFTEKYADS